jgi:signal transduction histidine kinase/ligand-binding sensor domain-containing protein/ActR/RegA family two-component response regulator
MHSQIQHAAAGLGGLTRSWSKGVSTFAKCVLLVSLMGPLSGAPEPASEPDFSAPALGFRQITSRDGLPSAETRRLLQDSRGFIWMATNAGLVRYDAHEFRLYSNIPNDPTSLAGNSVWDIVETPEGDIWVATEVGLDLWHRKTERFSRVPLNDPEDHQPRVVDVRTLILDQEKRLWVGTRNAGVIRSDPLTQNAETIPLRSQQGMPLGNEVITAFVLDAQGTVWVGTRSGLLLHYEKKTGCLLPYSHFPQEEIRDIDMDATGRFWIATGNGAYLLNPSSGALKHYAADPGKPGALSAPIIDDILIDRQGNVWVGTNNGGLNLFNPKDETFYHYRHSRKEPKSLVSDATRNLFEDENGDLWVSHFPEGISYLNHLNLPFGTVHVLENRQLGITDDYPWCFAEDAEGGLWIGSDKGGLSHWSRKSGRWDNYLNDPLDAESIAANTVATVAIDHAGFVWAGTWNGGVNRLDLKTGKFKRFLPEAQHESSIGSRHIKHILEDSQHRLWIATDGDGINRLDTKTGAFAHYHADPVNSGALGTSLVWCLYETKDGSLWAGTNKGPALYDAKTDRWSSYKNSRYPDHDLWRNPVCDIRESRDGSLWFGTTNAGLYRLDRGTGLIEHYGTETGLPENTIRGVAEDQAGFLWISTSKELCRLDPSTRQLRLYDQSNGLQGGQFMRHSYLKLRSGELVFGGVDGFNIFDPAKIEANTILPELAITAFEVFNQPMLPGDKDSPLTESITETKNLGIPSSMSVIRFTFAALSYRSPERNRIRYMLEGFDSGWRDVGLEQSATYTNLNPGKYTLRVKASNNEGVWNEQGLSLGLEIIPPFYSTLWFKALGGFLIVLASVLISRNVSHRRLRLRLMEAEKERLLALERQKLAEKHAKLEQQLMQANKVESIGRLAGGVAHDLNNMLLPILGFSELTLEDLPPDHPVRGNVEEIRKAAGRSRDLVRQLLAFARKQPLQMQVLQMNSVVEGLLPMLHRTLRENISIKTRLAERLPSIKGDIGQIEQVILNLSVNAQDAMPSGGSLFFETSQVSLSKDDALQGMPLPSGPYVLLSVSDTGVGIPKELLERVFEPFFTTKEKGKGTGLGLAMVEGIVRQHGGEIRIYSEEQKGTTIRVYFPAVDAAASTIANTRENAPEYRCSGNILLVEDVEQVRILTSRILSRAGYSVFTAQDSKSALDFERQHPEKIDLLISDVVLPDINGKELHLELSKRRPGLKVLFMSGYTTDVISHQGVIDQGVQFISKPFKITELLEKIQSVLVSSD